MNFPLEPDCILITGATGGIGWQLALTYAEPGKTLVLQGRNMERLQVLANACRSRGAEVICKVLDLRDRAGLLDWLKEVCVMTPPNLAIINAGVNTDIGKDGQGEPWEDVEALIEVNVIAAMAMVHELVPVMRKRGHGQIALMSSLAAWFGLPITPAYSASKAAIKTYGEALRGWLSKDNIRVNVIMPGYVESAMCDAMPGPKPFLWGAERAANKIRKGLAADCPRISFPFPLNFGVWLLAVFPVTWSLQILRWLGYGNLQR